MTTELTTPSDPTFATPAGRSGERSTHDVGPYAQPSLPPSRQAVDAVLIDAIRATIGPFVPAPWRNGAAGASGFAAGLATGLDESPAVVQTNTPTVELPWIDTFLDDAAGTDAADAVDGATEGALGEAFVEEAAVVEAEAVTADAAGGDAAPVSAEFALPTGDAAPEVADIEAQRLGIGQLGADAEEQSPSAESIAEAFADDVPSVIAESHAAESVSPPADAWPMDEAGAAMKALAGEMPSPPQRAITPLYVPPVASTPPLPVWGDDDLMDIMPVRAPAAADVSEEHWAASARREAERAGNPEAAARALEDLARRVRAGQLELPGYAAEMGDAAALAAALAALLGVRR
jgi:hypothetical protein